jgi:LCP family protein required for cell wall assembly
MIDQRRAARRARRRSRAIRIIAAAVAVGLLAGMGAIAANPLGVLAQQPVPPTDVIQLRAAHGASFVPALDGRRPIFILALGSDARPGQVITRQRADSIHIIGVNPARRKATVLGFPRDSWVHIPGVGSSKINNALRYGGPQLMVRTIEALTGIRIDFYLLTSFGGLERMIEAIGGLVVDVPYAMNDPYSHAKFSPGVQRLKGWQALAFARNRKDTPNGDFSRSLNQGRLFLSALAQLRSEFRERPARLLTWLVAGSRHVRTDLSFATLIDLATTATQISPADVRNLAVPGTSGFVGSASVVFLSPGGSGLYSNLRADGVID